MIKHFVRIIMMIIILCAVHSVACADACPPPPAINEVCTCSDPDRRVTSYECYSYLYCDETYHYKAAYKNQYCWDCRKVVNDEHYLFYIITVEHFTYGTDTCYDCGYTAGLSPTCQHPNKTAHYDSSIPLKVISTTLGAHTVQYGYKMVCDDCGVETGETGYFDAVTEKHTFTTGVCICGDHCPHWNYTEFYDESREIIYFKYSESLHDVLHPYKKICSDCGSTEEFYYAKDMKPHTYQNGYCVCGAQNPECTHASYTDHYDATRQAKFSNSTQTTHNVQYPYDRICNDCGYVQKIYSDPQTVAHEFGTNGKCSYCGYDRTASCTHQYAANMDKPVWNTGVYTYTSTYHTRISCDYEQYCTLCGTKGPNLTVSESITGAHWYSNNSYEYNDEMHWYKYATCRGCGYERDRGYAYHTFVNGKCAYCGYAEQYSLAVKIDGVWDQSDTVVVDKDTYFGVGIINGATGNAFSPDNVTFKIERNKELVLSKQDEYTYFADNYGSCVLSLYKDNKLIDTMTVTVGRDEVVAKLEEFLNHCASVSASADRIQERSFYESVTLDLFTKGTGALTDGVKRIAGYQGIIKDEEMMQIVESMVLAEMDEVEYLTNTAFASLAELSKDASDVADLCKKFAIDPLSDNWLTKLGEAIATNEEGHYRSGELVEKVIKIKKAHDVYAVGTEALGGVTSFVQWLNDTQDAKRTYEMRSYMQAEAKEHLDALAAGFSDPHMVEVIKDYQAEVEHALANLVIEQTITTLEGGEKIYGSYCKVVKCLKDAGVFKHLPKNVEAYTKAEKAVKEFKIGGKFKVEDIMDGMEIFDTIATVEGLLGNGKGLVESLDILEREHMALEKEVDAIVNELNTFYTYDAVTKTFTFNLTKNQITLRLNALGALCMATLNSLEDTTNILHKMYTEETIGKLIKLIDRDGYEQAIKDIPEILKEIAEYKETTQNLLTELQNMIEKYPNFPQ